MNASGCTPPRRRTLEEFVRERFDLAHRVMTDAHVACFDGDAEAVHRMRVATRRLRSDLRTFELLVDRARIEGLDDDLRHFARALGAVRDLDVIRPQVERSVTALPAAHAEAGAALVAVLVDQRRAALAALQLQLASRAHEALIVRIATLVADPPVAVNRARSADAEPAVRRAVRRSVKADARRARHLGPRPSPAELHELRKRVKRSRYGATALAELTDRKADRRLAKQLGAVQDELGGMQDATMSAAWLATQVATGDAQLAAFAAGFVLGASTTAPAGPPHRRWRRLRLALRALAETQA